MNRIRTFVRAAFAALCGLGASEATASGGEDARGVAREYFDASGGEHAPLEVDRSRIEVTDLTNERLEALEAYVAGIPALELVSVHDYNVNQDNYTVRLAVFAADYVPTVEALISFVEGGSGYVMPVLERAAGGTYKVSPGLSVRFHYSLDREVMISALESIPNKASVRLVSTPGAGGVDRERREHGFRPEEFFEGMEEHMEFIVAQTPRFYTPVEINHEYAYDSYWIGLNVSNGFAVMDSAEDLAKVAGVAFASPSMSIAVIRFSEDHETPSRLEPWLWPWLDVSLPTLSFGWLAHPLFGNFYNSSQPWYYHETLGWFYTESASSDDVWLYLDSAGQYFWTQLSTETYPHMVREDGVWFYYLIGSENPRWFYNYSTEAWENF